MKKLFIISVVLCILGWVCFEISVGIVGYRYTGPAYSYVYPDHFANGKGKVFGGDYTNSTSWTIVNKFPDININSAGVNTIVTRGEGNDIKVYLHDPEQKKVHIEAVYENNSLTIEARSPNITFVPNGSFGLVSWLEDIFTGGSSSTTVIIEFPEAKYDSLHIQQGSGTMKVRDLYADRNNIHIGSGSFEFLRRSESFVSDVFEFELGSGKAVLSGVQTERYNIDIGSGSFDISGLSGEGHIDMGSGSGNIAYKEYNGDCALDIGSGNMKLFVPENSSIQISADIGSGTVSIDACDVKTDITSHNDEEPFVLGGGEHFLEIGMGSGKVSILDLADYPKPAIEEIIIGSYVDIIEGTEFSFSSTGIIQSSSYDGKSSGVFGLTEEPGYLGSQSTSEYSSSAEEPTEVPDDQINDENSDPEEL